MTSLFHLRLAHNDPFASVDRNERREFRRKFQKLKKARKNNFVYRQEIHRVRVTGKHNYYKFSTLIYIFSLISQLPSIVSQIRKN